MATVWYVVLYTGTSLPEGPQCLSLVLRGVTSCETMIIRWWR